MSINDYVGIDGFCVDAKNLGDCIETIDRLHTQIMDRIDELVGIHISPEIDRKNIDRLEQVLGILEKTMEDLSVIDEYCV